MVTEAGLTAPVSNAVIQGEVANPRFITGRAVQLAQKPAPRALLDAAPVSGADRDTISGAGIENAASHVQLPSLRADHA